MTRARDVADQQKNLGGAVPPVVAGKNFVINGGMDFFQRSSFSTTTSGYSLDRWYTNVGGSASATTVTQQSTGAPSGCRYHMRVAMGAGSGYGNVYHFFDTSTTAALWGKTVTLSLKVRRSSNFTRFLTLVVQKSATVDAGAGATWTVMGTVNAGNADMPTGTTSSDWYTLSITFAVPTDGTANSLSFYTAMSNVDTSSYYEMGAVQLEIGSAATPFSRAGGTLQGEEQACRRYYQRWQLAVANYNDITIGQVYSSTSVYLWGQFPVEMRAIPTGARNGLCVIVNNQGTRLTGGTYTLYSTSPKNYGVTYTHGSASLTAGQFAVLQINNSTTEYLEFSAEL